MPTRLLERRESDCVGLVPPIGSTTHPPLVWIGGSLCTMELLVNDSDSLVQISMDAKTRM